MNREQTSEKFKNESNSEEIDDDSIQSSYQSFDRSNNSRSTGKALPADFQPAAFDVICERGHKAYNHEGNKWFQQLILSRVEQYSNANSKHFKSQIVSNIVSIVCTRSHGQLSTSSNGSGSACGHGGFVRYQNGSWYEMGESFAREKVGQAFRNASHLKYKSSSLSKKVRRDQRREPKDHQKLVVNRDEAADDALTSTVQHSETGSKRTFEQQSTGELRQRLIADLDKGTPGSNIIERTESERYHDGFHPSAFEPWNDRNSDKWDSKSAAVERSVIPADTNLDSANRLNDNSNLILSQASGASVARAPPGTGPTAETILKSQTTTTGSSNGEPTCKQYSSIHHEAFGRSFAPVDEHILRSDEAFGRPFAPVDEHILRNIFGDV